MEDLYNNDTKFMAFLIKEICDYAIDNNMSPDDTIKTIATNLLTLLSISTFEHWQKEEEKKGMKHGSIYTETEEAEKL